VIIRNSIFLSLLLSFSIYGINTKVGFVFDLEGTLAPTEWVWFLANDQLLESHNIVIDEAARELLNTMPAGCGLKRSIELLQERFPLLKGTVQELMQQKAELGLKNIENEDNKFEYYTGLEQFLTNIKERSCSVAIATNCSTRGLNCLRKKLKLEDYFGEHIYNPDSVDGNAKPNPAMYLYAVEKIGLQPENCIAFEDSPSGAKAAKDAGLYVVGYDSSANTELSKYADMIITRWCDLNVDDLIYKVNS